MDDYDIIKGKRTYRYFDKKVLYPFGYGLTYTSFHRAGSLSKLIRIPMNADTAWVIPALPPARAPFQPGLPLSSHWALKLSVQKRGCALI